MCPGTLFMVKFVNGLEREYPFADNLHPVTALAGILGKDRMGRLASAAWMLSQFAIRHPSTMLTDHALEDHDVRLRRALLDDPTRLREFVRTYRRAVNANATEDWLRARLDQPGGVAGLFLDLMAALPFDEWLAIRARRHGYCLLRRTLQTARWPSSRAAASRRMRYSAKRPRRR